MLRDSSPKTPSRQYSRECANSRPMSAPMPRPGSAVTPQIQTNNDLEVRNDDDDFDIWLNPRGSLLAATHDPYDKNERIRTANANLRSEKLAPRTHPAKVRFNEKIRMLDINEETVMEGVNGSVTKSVESDSDVVSESKVHLHPKILLVNVPTGFSEDIEEIPSDDGEFSHEPDFRSLADGQSDETVESSGVADEQTEMIDDEDKEEDASELGAKEDSEDEDVEDLTQNFHASCHLKEHDDQDLGMTCGKKDEGRESQEKVGSDPKTQTWRQGSVEQLNRQNKIRPSTAPPASKRNCQNNWANIKLPFYNGHRSEYGLSAEQLEERKKRRDESAKVNKQQKELLIQEQKKRQKENEQMFASWLVKKKKEAALKAARRRQNLRMFRLKTLPAPTSHLEKMGVVRKKVLARREHTCYSLEEYFRNAKPHEQRTYRIYLGLCVE